MMDYFILYLAVGLVLNIFTMFNKDAWEYWVEYGFTGFIIQLVASTVLFPLALAVIKKELIDKD